MKPSSTFHDQLYANLNLKETSELLIIWHKNDRTAWTDEAFDVIHQILQARLKDAPKQGVPMDVAPQTPVRRFSQQKLTAEGHLAVGLICLLIAVGLAYLITQVPQVSQFLTDEIAKPGRRRGGLPVMLVLFIVGLGFCGIGELFHAWQESRKEARLARRKMRKGSWNRKQKQP